MPAGTFDAAEGGVSEVSPERRAEQWEVFDRQTRRPLPREFVWFTDLLRKLLRAPTDDERRARP